MSVEQTASFATQGINDALARILRDRDDWKTAAERRMQERDELLEALEAAIRAMDLCEAQLCTCHRGPEYEIARAIITRIKG